MGKLNWERRNQAERAARLSREADEAERAWTLRARENARAAREHAERAGVRTPRSEFVDREQMCARLDLVMKMRPRAPWLFV